MRNSKELFDLDYLYWLLSSKYVYNQFCKKASGATVDNLNKEKVASAVIPLPPINEQKRIVHRIEELLQTIQTRGVL
ncbi:MAG: restriction endonuclease subunit S [Lachnospiraceae bacterium]|nr:restriction endonuclease subunit S [Lachnospiraceae bacterium]